MASEQRIGHSLRFPPAGSVVHQLNTKIFWLLRTQERLSHGDREQNATAGDRSSYHAMAYTFILYYFATKAGIKGASVVMGYL